MKYLFRKKNKQTAELEIQESLKTNDSTIEGKSKDIKEKRKTSASNDKKIKSKPRQRSKRICYYCLENFSASRSDAMYCSNRCRQSAFEKGDVLQFPNPAEHFFVQLIKFIISEILNNQFIGVDIYTIIKWRSMLETGEMLFRDHIGRNNQFLITYYNQVIPALQNIEGLIKTFSNGRPMYTVDPNIIEHWEWLVKSLNKYDK